MLLPPQSGAAIPSTPIELIKSASYVTQGVLALLACLSLVSWGIILAKWLEFRRVYKASDAFLNEFAKVSRLEQAVGLSKRVKPSPYTRVFARAIQFLHDTRPLGADGGDARAPLSGSQVEALRLLLDAASNSERDQLGSPFPVWRSSGPRAR
jgi:biopolymer transport protein TolQ